MPSTTSIVREKDYCDLLYAWLQCNSERENINTSRRRIEKKKVKWIRNNFISVSNLIGSISYLSKIKY